MSAPIFPEFPHVADFMKMDSPTYQPTIPTDPVCSRIPSVGKFIGFQTNHLFDQAGRQLDGATDIQEQQVWVRLGVSRVLVDSLR